MVSEDPAGNMFQSTPPHGGRLRAMAKTAGTKMFQSTPPHGGRPIYAPGVLIVSGFNPRPRMGGDLDADGIFGGTDVSIHAPAWGAT